MPQSLEFASSQWNRSPRTTFSRRTLGASPVAVRNPGPEKSYEAPDNFPAPGLLHVSPVVTGASASVGALFVSRVAKITVSGSRQLYCRKAGSGLSQCLPSFPPEPWCLVGHQGFLGALSRLGLRHCILNHACDHREYRTADAATDQLAYDNFPIDSARSRRKCRNERTKNLPATNASKSASNGIPGCTQIDILHAGSSRISSDGANLPQ